MVCGGSLTENLRNRKKFKALFWRVDMSTCLKNFYNTSFFLLDSVQDFHFFSKDFLFLCISNLHLYLSYHSACSVE